MTRSKKFEITLFITTLVILIGLWAINGYEKTWFYVVMMIIAIPIGWYNFDTKKRHQ